MMVSWLAKTTQLLQRRQPPEPPPPFEVGCSCGHQVSGIRKPTYQSDHLSPLRQCSFFVLPIDVYPKPKPKKALPEGRNACPSVRSGSSGQNSPTATRAVTRGQAPHAAAQTASTTATQPGAPAPPPSHKAKAVDVVTVDVRQPLVSRFRLILLAIGGVVGATGYFVWQSRLTDQALVSLPVHLEAGRRGVRAGAVPKAAEEYRQAAWAVDRLRREDAESIGIRQKAKELGAVVHLSTVSLFDICEEARKDEKEVAEKWAAKFNEQYKGSWIVVEGDVTQERGPDGIGEPIIRFPYPIDGSPWFSTCGCRVWHP